MSGVSSFNHVPIAYFCECTFDFRLLNDTVVDKDSILTKHDLFVNGVNFKH